MMCCSLRMIPVRCWRIALMAASVPIGAAGGILAAKLARAGSPISEMDSTTQILDLLKRMTTGGVDAVFGAHGEDGAAK